MYPTPPNLMRYIGHRDLTLIYFFHNFIRCRLMMQVYIYSAGLLSFKSESEPLCRLCRLCRLNFPQNYTNSPYSITLRKKYRCCQKSLQSLQSLQRGLDWDFTADKPSKFMQVERKGLHEPYMEEEMAETPVLRVFAIRFCIHLEKEEFPNKAEDNSKNITRRITVVHDYHAKPRQSSLSAPARGNTWKGR